MSLTESLDVLDKSSAELNVGDKVPNTQGDVGEVYFCSDRIVDWYIACTWCILIKCCYCICKKGYGLYWTTSVRPDIMCSLVDADTSTETVIYDLSETKNEELKANEIDAKSTYLLDLLTGTI